MREPGFPGGEGAFADHLVAEFFVAHFAFCLLVELFEQVEGDVGGLEVGGVGVAEIVDKRAVGAGAGGGRSGCEQRPTQADRGLEWATAPTVPTLPTEGEWATRQNRGGDAGEQAGGDGFDVAFDAAELAGEEDVGVLLHLQGWR